MISQEAQQKILGMEEVVRLNPHDMAKEMTITVVPFNREKLSANIVNALDLLLKTLKKHGVSEIPYDEAFQVTPFKKRLKRFFKFIIGDILWFFNFLTFRPQKSFFIGFKTIRALTAKKRYKKGVCIIVPGELPADHLPMQRISSFKDNSIISVLDFPENINDLSDFTAHFDTAMALFAYHMTNIVVAADDKRWMIYNFNASHPIFDIDSPEFEDHIVKGLIPKVVAPISPHRFSEFIISKKTFDVHDSEHSEIIKDILDGSAIFNETNLFPAGKKIDDLPFRRNFHRLIGKMHLDNRSGMSFGFLAKQMPVQSSRLINTESEEGKQLIPGLKNDTDDYFTDEKGRLHILLEIQNNRYILKVPDVWVMSIRSGANKTNINPATDLLKLGLIDGRMYIELPTGLQIDHTYKPSFDTKVILAHAVGNAIIASISKHVGCNHAFVENMEKKGMSMSHWHGYFNKSFIPESVHEYGKENAHVACSSPQSALYALGGKLVNFEVQVLEKKLSYKGDIHVEPHHGSNVNYPDLVELATYLRDNPQSVALGNKYL